MADASIWQPGSGIPLLNAGISYSYEHVIATAGQTVFNITEFEYVVGTNSLQIFLQGLAQTLGVDFTETTTTSFTFTSPLQGGERVLIAGFIGPGDAGVTAAAGYAEDAAMSAAESAASALAALNSENNSLQYANDSAASYALAEHISSSLAGGTIGFDSAAYDFGSVADATTYFNRDFGTL